MQSSKLCESGEVLGQEGRGRGRQAEVGRQWSGGS